MEIIVVNTSSNDESRVKNYWRNKFLKLLGRVRGDDYQPKLSTIED